MSKYGTWMTLFYPNPTAVELSNSTYKNSTLIFYSQGILEKQGENLPWISRTPINSNPSPSSFSSILCTTTISVNHWPTIRWTCSAWRRWKQGTMRQTRHTWTWREAWIGRFKMLITPWIIRGILRKVIPRSLPTSLIKKENNNNVAQYIQSVHIHDAPWYNNDQIILLLQWNLWQTWFGIHTEVSLF